MSDTTKPTEPDAIRDEWIARLGRLVAEVESWARATGWEVSRITKPMQDSGIGRYEAPALVFQREFTRLLLDPISREVPGADGVVDLYKMPALDDIASIYSVQGRWQIHHVPSNDGAVARVAEAEARPLTRESFEAVVSGMGSHGA